MGTRVSLILAILLGVVAAVAIRAWLHEEREAIEKPYDPIAIVAAKRNLRPGDELNESNAAQKWIAKELAVGGLIPANEFPFYRGRLLRRNVMRGEPVFKDMLEVASRKRQTLEHVVREGRRAVTLRVDQVSGVGGLVRPGDYVDVVATFSGMTASADGADAVPPAGGRTAARSTKTIVLLQAVKVLAVDSRTLEASTRRGAGGGGYRTVTLEVAPWDALRLINAQSQAALHLLLRSPADAEEVPVEAEGVPVHWDTRLEAVETVEYTAVPRPAGDGRGAEDGEDER